MNGEFNEIRLTILIEAKISEENKQKAHLEEKICLNYTKMHKFLQKKIHSMRIQMTPINAEFTAQFDDIR